MDKMLYKYTTLESLALILKSKSIRLNPLTEWMIFKRQSQVMI